MTKEERMKQLEKQPEDDLNLVIGGLKLGFYSEPDAEIIFNEDTPDYRVIKVRVKKEKELTSEDEFLEALEAGQIAPAINSSSASDITNKIGEKIMELEAGATIQREYPQSSEDNSIDRLIQGVEKIAKDQHNGKGDKPDSGEIKLADDVKQFVHDVLSDKQTKSNPELITAVAGLLEFFR